MGTTLWELRVCSSSGVGSGGRTAGHADRIGAPAGLAGQDLGSCNFLTFWFNQPDGRAFCLADGPGSSLDSGLRAIMFTDLEGSTAVSSRDGDHRAMQVIERHDDIVCTPGQILVSAAVKELAIGKSLGFIDRGPIALKGFDDPIRIYQVGTLG